jgi:hypothetical protein
MQRKIQCCSTSKTISTYRHNLLQDVPYIEVLGSQDVDNKVLRILGRYAV